MVVIHRADVKFFRIDVWGGAARSARLNRHFVSSAIDKK
jgi:hypothetical protein